MKKPNRKSLTLSKETVARLSNRDLQRAGAGWVRGVGTSPADCGPSVSNCKPAGCGDLTGF